MIHSTGDPTVVSEVVVKEEPIDTVPADYLIIKCEEELDIKKEDFPIVDEEEWDINEDYPVIKCEKDLDIKIERVASEISNYYDNDQSVKEAVGTTGKRNFIGEEYPLKFYRKIIPITQKQSPCAKQFLCDECGKEFTRMQYLNEHQKTHVEKSFECAQCGLRFVDKRGLQDHAGTHIKVEKLSFVCEICEKSFTPGTCNPWFCPLKIRKCGLDWKWYVLYKIN